ncbi:LUC7-related [Macleaya cordata]|uniref:LUC7-related n=1 Tax=Macleaya cordata TaxID=56857 RepID=A0A200QE98_MACCD|nr:LUC7-related [Macleaya cordata]
MDALRKQLDVLMGANRNGDVTEVNRKYYDRDVCRLFLVGLCPHELFQLTKMDMGPCPKVHSLQLRKEYEEAKAKGSHNYDRELEDVIDRLIVECDRKITRALKRLEEDDAKAAIAISVSEVTQSPEVLELSKQIKEKLKEVDQLDLEGMADNKIRALEVVEELRAKRADKQSMLLLDAFNKDRASLQQPLPAPPPLAPLPVLAPPDRRTQEMINEKLKKAEDLGELGMVDEAQKALEEAEALKKLGARQEPQLDSSKYTADVRITDQKLRVCDICGAFLSVYDSDRRLADHFGGKLHLGYMQIREKLIELQVPLMHIKTIACWAKAGSEERNKSRKVDRTEDERRYSILAFIEYFQSCLSLAYLFYYLYLLKNVPMDSDQKSEVWTVIGPQAGTRLGIGRIGVIPETGEEIMIVGTEIMTEIATGNEREILIGLGITIPEVVGGHDLGLGIVLRGIMAATGGMIGTDYLSYRRDNPKRNIHDV